MLLYIPNVRSYNLDNPEIMYNFSDHCLIPQILRL